EGILCVGVVVPAIPSESGRFGVSITTLKSLATEERIDKLVKTATTVAHAVSRPFGGSGTTDAVEAAEPAVGDAQIPGAREVTASQF
ncbi:MAG: hypothetical protein ACJLS2_14875, partial [Microcella pacifica]